MLIYIINSISLVHRPPKCDIHGHFCPIFGNIAILTNSSTLISKVVVPSSILLLRWSFRACPYDVTVQIRSFLSFTFLILNLIDPLMVSKDAKCILKTIKKISKTLFLPIKSRHMTTDHTLL